MSWANSVLPVFMAASGQKPGRLPELPIAVQIETTRHRSESPSVMAFSDCTPSFNRTAVSGAIDPKQPNALQVSGQSTARAGRDAGAGIRDSVPATGAGRRRRGG